MGDEILTTVSDIAKEMRRRDPFLAFMLVVGGLLVGWYVYQQQVMNDRLVGLQVDAMMDAKEKVEVVRSLVAAQNKAAEIAESSARIQERSANNIARLVTAVSEERTFNVGTRALVLDAVQGSKASADATTKAVEELVDHIQARDASQ